MSDETFLKRRSAKPRRRAISPAYPRLVALGALAVAAACGGSVDDYSSAEGGNATGYEVVPPIPGEGGSTTTEGWGGGLDGASEQPWGGSGGTEVPTGGSGGAGASVGGAGGGIGGGLDGDMEGPWGGGGTGGF